MLEYLSWADKILWLTRPATTGVALDFSPTMLERARERFIGDGSVRAI